MTRIGDRIELRGKRGRIYGVYGELASVVLDGEKSERIGPVSDLVSIEDEQPGVASLMRDFAAELQRRLREQFPDPLEDIFGRAKR